MRKTLIGTNDDGSPHYLIVAEQGETAVYTGPIVAEVEAGGVTYDVSSPVVVVPDDHVAQLNTAIGEWYAANGHPDAPDGFVHNTDTAPATSPITPAPSATPTTTSTGA